MVNKKMFSSEVKGYRVQVFGNNVRVFFKKNDSTCEVPQKIQIEDREALESLWTAIGSVIDQYSEEKDE